MSFGDFQADVGRASSSVNMVGAYIGVAVAFVIFGFSLYLSLTPMRWSPSSGGFCGNPNLGNVTCSGGETCVEGRCRAPPKRHVFPAAIGGVILLLSFFGVWYSKAMDTAVQSNKGFAQLNGLATEASMIANIRHRNE